jgi:hypothetical protein
LSLVYSYLKVYFPHLFGGSGNPPAINKVEGTANRP